VRTEEAAKRGSRGRRLTAGVKPATATTPWHPGQTVPTSNQLAAVPTPKPKGGDAAPPCQRRRLPSSNLSAPLQCGPRPSAPHAKAATTPPPRLLPLVSPRPHEGAVAWRRFQFLLSTALAGVFGFDDCPIKQQQRRRRETRRSEKEAPFQGKGLAFRLNLAAPRRACSRFPAPLATLELERQRRGRERRSLCLSPCGSPRGCSWRLKEEQRASPGLGAEA